MPGPHRCDNSSYTRMGLGVTAVDVTGLEGQLVVFDNSGCHRLRIPGEANNCHLLLHLVLGASVQGLR